MTRFCLIASEVVQNEAFRSVPTWLIVGVVALVVLFTILLIRSPIGSNKRRGRRRTIL